jgi:hypothetical protein
MTPSAKSFDPSSCAAAFDGPKTLKPADRSASDAPFTSGTSGPITTRSINNSYAKETIAALFVMSSGCNKARSAIPGLPGAQ